MKSRIKRRLGGRAGATLVEMMVSLLILGIILNMGIGILSPAAKLFLQMQRLQRAEVILDNVVLQLREIVGQATRYVKIYPAGTGDVTDRPGADTGDMLEFLNPEGFVALVGAGGCPQTEIVVGGVAVDTAQPVEEGQLLVRYYAKTSADSQTDPVTGQKVYRYQCKGEGGLPAARAVLGVFPGGYYMGNTLEISFSYGAGTDDALENLLADVRLYTKDQEGNKTLLLQETGIILDLRYSAAKNSGITAAAPAEP